MLYKSKKRVSKKYFLGFGCLQIESTPLLVPLREEVGVGKQGLAYKSQAFKFTF